MKARLALLSIALLAVANGAMAAEALPRPGDRFEIRAFGLPEPGAGTASNSPRRIPLGPEVAPDVPAGFRVNRFAEGLTNARWMTVAPGGEVFLAEPDAGHVLLLIDRNRDGVAEERHVLTGGFDRPHGLALRGGWLYVADVRGIWRLEWKPGQTAAKVAPEMITPPGALGGTSGHWTRNIAFSPDGTALFAAIGSAANIAEEKAPRATVMRFDMEAETGFAIGGRVYASGLRNPVGIAFHPDTGALYVTVNERDGMGDELVPDYLTALKDDGFYGWPYAYIGGNPQPGLAEMRPKLVKASIVPDLLFRSHSAPLGLVFAGGLDVPEDWKDDAFVALHGSWNASQPRGYMVVRVPFAGGRPQGGYEAFATGFRSGTYQRLLGDAAEIWGRPAGLAAAADGSLLIADDVANVIWRVSRVR